MSVDLPAPLGPMMVTISPGLVGVATIQIRDRTPPTKADLAPGGFLGGYTTYSTFAFESLTLWERGERGISLAYVASTVLVGFVAVTLGVALARDLTIPQDERTARSDTQTRIEVSQTKEAP